MRNKTSVERIVRSTQHVLMCEPQKMNIVGIGSGCIINYRERKFFLSVEHVTNVEAVACLDVGEENTTKEWKLYSVGPLNYISRFSLDKLNDDLQDEELENKNKEKKRLGTIDFCYTEIENLTIKQKSTNTKQFSIPKNDKLIIDTELGEKPVPRREYAFFGRIRPAIIDDAYFQLEDVFYDGLSLKKEVGDFYLFELPQEIKDHEHFRGCSGAPIMDSEGRVVALVTHGYKNTKRLFGISLEKFKPVLDAAILIEGNQSS